MVSNNCRHFAMIMQCYICSYILILISPPPDSGALAVAIVTVILVISLTVNGGMILIVCLLWYKMRQAPAIKTANAAVQDQNEDLYETMDSYQSELQENPAYIHRILPYSSRYSYPRHVRRGFLPSIKEDEEYIHVQYVAQKSRMPSVKIKHQWEMCVVQLWPILLLGQASR